MAASKMGLALRVAPRVAARTAASSASDAIARRLFSSAVLQPAVPAGQRKAQACGTRAAATSAAALGEGKVMRMTTEEAFVKVLQMHGISNSFGIIGSAMMPISDLFPVAGIKFWDCAHEYNAGMMADGYSRTTGRMSMMIAQNGPGITNFVTPVKTAYWNHTPLLLVTPQAANKTIGQGGFQEVPQMAMFEDCVCYQEEVRDPTRIAEVLNRVIEKAIRGSAPAQINVPRDMWCKEIEIELPRSLSIERSAGGQRSLAEAAELLSQARFPVILNGAGAILSAGGIDASRRLAERLCAPVCCNYQHNDAFPGGHPLSAGPLGYNGSKAAMQLIAQADVVLALGTRLNPFSTLPGYGMDYWPKQAKLIQVDINADRIGLTKPVAVGIQADARLAAEAILSQLSAAAGDAGRAEREALVRSTKEAWAAELATMDHEADDAGTTWNQRARAREPTRMSPRMAWRAVKRVLPADAIISTDIGNNCAIGNAYPTFEEGRKYLSPGLFGPCGYGFPSILGAKIGQPQVPVVGFAGDGAFGISMNELTACGRNDWPPVTMVVFRNYQWGAEKRNTTLWYQDNFVGTELNLGVEYAQVAKACGLVGVKVETVEDLEAALASAIDGQMQRNETTLIEVVLNQELGEPFRRDAMRPPVHINEVRAEDMRSQG
mmetsp:Transcript_31520/g.100497  ORF Transcript_31520/g.100497 Transcript_31520/m.100497 type:complete len:662 (+) Transcript_31520:41-2026(+)